MHKKGFIHTLEVVLSVTVMFVFITFIIQRPLTNPKVDKTPILQMLAQDTTFRSCVTGENIPCIQNTIRNYLPVRFDFSYSIGIEAPRSDLPTKDINTDTFFFAGNTTVYSPKLLKIYYWKKV